MRGPILNISPGLGASGVDMEYRRNSQGTRRFRPPSATEVPLPFISRRLKRDSLIFTGYCDKYHLGGRIVKPARHELPGGPDSI